MSKTVYCKVKEKDISGDDCIIVCDVADGFIKPTCLPDDIKWNNEQKQKCTSCKYHADID